jgi:phosphoribosylglycinamide formyltransferase-1
MSHPNKLNLAIIISGNGSTMESIVRACADPAFPARVSVVISNRPDAGGLAKAKAHRIPAVVVDHKHYADRATFEDALQKTLDCYPVDMICLAGFMRVLGDGFVTRWTGRMVNTHPSLLPRHKGLYGIHVHEAVLKAGDAESGCTIHFVVPEVDGGPVVLQKKVSVLPSDTPESLAARVLEQEHIAYPEAVSLLARHRVAFRPIAAPLEISPDLACSGETKEEFYAMSDHHHTATPAEVDPHALAEACAMWGGFTKFAKYGIIGAIVIMIFLALVTL